MENFFQPGLTVLIYVEIKQVMMIFRISAVERAAFAFYEV